MDLKFTRAWDDFTAWLKQNRESCFMTPFSCSVLSLKKLDDYPCLKAKGAACATCSKWLAVRAAEYADAHPQHVHIMRALTLRGFAVVYEAYHFRDDNGMMTEAEANILEQGRSAALLGYNACAKAAVARGAFLWPIIPKYHKLDHLLRRSIRTRMSASMFWTFSDEDMMKWMSSTVRNSHGLGLLKFPIMRWLLFLSGRSIRQLLSASLVEQMHCARFEWQSAIGIK